MDHQHKHYPWEHGSLLFSTKTHTLLLSAPTDQISSAIVMHTISRARRAAQSSMRGKRQCWSFGLTLRPLTTITANTVHVFGANRTMQNAFPNRARTTAGATTEPCVDLFRTRFIIIRSLVSKSRRFKARLTYSSSRVRIRLAGAGDGLHCHHSKLQYLPQNLRDSDRIRGERQKGKKKLPDCASNAKQGQLVSVEVIA